MITRPGNSHTITLTVCAPHTQHTRSIRPDKRSFTQQHEVLQRKAKKRLEWR